MEIKFYMKTALEKFNIDEQDKKTADYIRINVFTPWLIQVKQSNNIPILVFDGMEYNTEFIKAFTEGLLIDRIDLFQEVQIISNEDETLIDIIKKSSHNYTFSEWLEMNQTDNLFLPPLKPQEAIEFLRKYLLGKKWHIPTSISTVQANTAIVHEILLQYSKEYRNETNQNASFLDKSKSFFKKGYTKCRQMFMKWRT